MLKIRAHKGLFDKWKSVGQRIEKLSSIVQNDITIEKADYQEFLQLCNKGMRDFENLIALTQRWVEYENDDL